MRDAEAAPTPGFGTSVLSTEVIWGVNQEVEDLCLSLSLYNFDFPDKIIFNNNNNNISTI